ncbi:hypothetical protein M9Y10_023438 [Tritrichomonas musculus]|uniref:Uncharacterized protein n=1 Tax=Tritrichomonas musculus TaxID=1915356 RepID=A0ABR2KW17_9EUKA
MSKFGVKPKLSGLFKKFSPHIWPAFSVGVSQLAANCSRKFMGLICQNSKTMSFNDAMAGFNAVIRIYGITDSVRLAISMALLPMASYSNSAGLYNRFLLLCLHAGWFNIVWSVLSCLLTSFWPKYLAMIISDSKDFISAAALMLKISNMEASYAWGRFLCQTILQALGFGGLATIYSIIAAFIVNIDEL